MFYRHAKSYYCTCELRINNEFPYIVDHGIKDREKDEDEKGGGREKPIEECQEEQVRLPNLTNKSFLRVYALTSKRADLLKQLCIQSVLYMPLR